jgi:uncharacterized membrane protein (Fun14 family)
MAQSPKDRRFDSDLPRVAALATAVSVASLLYYFRAGQILMHGDAVAHLNIARRVFDSLTPGPLQLGTVWLPLPHVLMIPFVWPDALWQSGIGGSIPSMIAYVLGVVGIFRLVRGMLDSDARLRSTARVGAWGAAFGYAANPDLIYTQATALTEAVYLTFFIWALVFFVEFVRSVDSGAREEAGTTIASRVLWRCAVCVTCAELSRYDGWFLAGAVGVAALIMIIRKWEVHSLGKLVLKFLVGIAIAPLLWLAYNAVVYQNPLEFANGPYSAKAIEQHVGAPYPGFHNLRVAGLYFLKSAQLCVAVGNWGRIWLLAAILATLAIARSVRRRPVTWGLALLWTPLLFYTLSIAYGSVIVHVPVWWPFASFNQRYGLEMLPLFAVSAGLLIASITGFASQNRLKVTIAALAMILVSYTFVWKAKPLCLQEASRNWQIRRSMDLAVERTIAGLRPESTFLMDVGAHVDVMERLGIPFRRVVNVENHRQWKRPVDPEGLWERTLADPAKYVDYVIVFDGDLVDHKVNSADLILLSEIHATNEPPARIYKTRRLLNQSR